MPDKSLKSRLKKLFSTSVIVRKIGKNKLRVIDTDDIQYTGTWRNDKYNRMFNSSGMFGANQQVSMAYQAQRLELFRDYDMMDTDPILSSALDLMSDESSVHNEYGQILSISSSNENIREILENLFYNVLNIEHTLWSWVRNIPIKYDTVIPLLSGENITIEELSNRWKNDKDTELWVYSVKDDTSEIVPGKIIWCDKTRTNSEIVKVVFDDDSFVETSPDHLFILRDGTSARADELKIDDSLMPFYRELQSERKNKMKDYEAVYNPKTDKYDFTHRLVSYSSGIKQKSDRGYVIHHKDFNKYNNCPNNLEKLNWYEHLCLHRKFAKKILHTPEVTEKRMKGIDRWLRSDKRKKMLSDKMTGIYPVYFEEYNNSELHASHNAIRSDNMKMIWSNEDKKREMSVKMKNGWKNNENAKNSVRQFMQRRWATPTIRAALIQKLKHKWSNEMLDIISTCIKTNDPLYKVTEHLLHDANFNLMWDQVNTKKLKFNSIYHKVKEKRDDFKSIKNHKVKNISVSDNADVYCMTVVGPNGEHDRHNFAICGNTTEEFTPNSGVFVKNCKYGDFFLYLEIDEQYGIYNVIPMSVYDTVRIEGEDPQNPFYVRFETNGMNMPKMKFENYEMAHFRLLSDSNFLPYGRCIEASTYVDTENGSKQICEIQKNDKVWSFNAKLNKLELVNVLNTIHSGTKNLLKIRTRHNFIECSEEHPILVMNKEGVTSYKEAKNISIGDNLVVVDLARKNSISYTIDKSMPDDITCPSFCPTTEGVPEIADEEFAEFIGFMLGDGWIKGGKDNPNYNGYRICFACGVDDEQNEKYKNILEKYAGKPVKYYRHCNDSKSKTAVVYSKQLYYILKNSGISGTAKTKRIPQWIFEASQSIQLACVRGLGNADASVSIDQWGVVRYQLELVGKNLILDTKRLLQMCGIKTSIPKTRHRGAKTVIRGTECNRAPSHRLTYYLDNPTRVQIEKYRCLQNQDGFTTDVVKSISNAGEGETYDIQVDSQNSNFIANGIIIHNSAIEAARRPWKQIVLLEDAMMIHRIVRAPERRKFKIDIGSIPPNEVDNYIQRMIDQMKKAPLIDPNTGDYNMKFNMQNILEDFFIPVRGKDSGTDIETLSGLTYLATDDIEYIKAKLLAALKIPKAFLGYEEGVNGKCIHPDTKIPLLSNETKTIKEIAELFENDNDPNLWAYSYDTVNNQIVPGKVILAQKTRKDAALVKITLDNGEFVKTTPDHGFVLRGGETIQAQNLKPGDSLQACYRRMKKIKKSMNEYEQVYQPNEDKWQWTHKMVDNHFNGKIENNGHGEDGRFVFDDLIIVHHADFNRFNNSPDNLKRVTNKEHREIHTKDLYKTILSPECQEKIRKTKQTKEYRDKMSVIRKKYMEEHPESKYIVRDAWMSLSHEERVRICKASCTPERMKESSKRSKIQYHSGNGIKMLAGYRKKFPNGRPDISRKNNFMWRDRPELNYIIEFINEYPNKNEINNFSMLSKKIGYHVTILREVFDCNGITATEFMNSQFGFKAGRSHDLPKIYNHKVVSVEFLEETSDTYNMEVECANDSHNFLIDSGIIIKNSTLSALDVRFARSIERIQRMVVSELTKIAIVHLYSQGFTDADLDDFELHLTNPSTIYEQEKISLWNEKMGLSAEIQESGLIGSNWIYENVFGFSEDEIEKQKVQVIKDAKTKFRVTSITTQGQDPAKAAVTPDANSLTPTFGDGGEGAGRPEEGINYGTDDHPDGRDPLGNKENESALDVQQKREPPRRTGFSRTESLKKLGLIKRNNLKLISESTDDKDKGTYLDENVLLS